MRIEGIVTNFLELFAAFSGFYYLKKNSNTRLRYFVYFLVVTVFVDAIGFYTSLYEQLDFLKVLKGTLVEHNLWLYNAFLIFSLFFYLIFYYHSIESTKHRLILKSLMIASAFLILFEINSIGLGFFKNNMNYTFIWTTFCVFVCVVFYFYKILMSDIVLKFYRLTLFYISIGLLVWWLILPPMIVYLPFYLEDFPNVVNTRITIIILSNVILYGCFIVGFLWGKEE